MQLTSKPKVSAAVFCTALLLWGGTALGEKLSLEQCEQLALKNSIESISNNTRLDSEKLKLSTSQASLMPNVSLSPLGVSVTGQDKGDSQVSPLSASLSIKQPLGQFLTSDGLFANATAIGSKLSDITWQIAQLDYQRTETNIRYEARAAYISLLKAQATLALNQEELKRIQNSLLPEVNAKLKAGVATKVDVIKIESQLRNAQLSVMKAENSLAASKDALLLLTGQAGKADGFELNPINLSSDDVRKLPATMQEAEMTAAGNRSEIKRAKLTLEQSKLQKRRTDINTSASVSLGARYNKTMLDEGFSLGAQSSINLKDLSLNNTITLAKPSGFDVNGSNWSVSLDLTSPILDWGQSESQRKQAANDVALAESALQQAENDVRSDVDSSFYGYKEAVEKLEVAKINLDANQSALAITRARYDAGVASSSENLDSELAVFESKSSVTQAEYDLYLAKDKLFKALDEERGAVVEQH